MDYIEISHRPDASVNNEILSSNPVRGFFLFSTLRSDSRGERERTRSIALVLITLPRGVKSLGFLSPVKTLRGAVVMRGERERVPRRANISIYAVKCSSGHDRGIAFLTRYYLGVIRDSASTAIRGKARH